MPVLHRIVECQTPTFIWVELVDGRVQIHADVAPEAPTVKGFVGILVDAFSGQPPETVLATPPDLLQRLGLLESLGMVRMRGSGGHSTSHPRTGAQGGGKRRQVSL